MRKVTTGIFSWTTRRLYDTIKSNKFKNNNLSHLILLFNEIIFLIGHPHKFFSIVPFCSPLVAVFADNLPDAQIWPATKGDRRPARYRPRPAAQGAVRTSAAGPPFAPAHDSFGRRP